MGKEHGKLIELDGWQNSNDYGDLDQLREMILYKRVKEINEDKVTLENGLVLTIECSEWDCCAGGEGGFKFDKNNVPLDAVITDFKIGEPEEVLDDDTIVMQNTISMFHNQNKIIEPNAETDEGNGGYYYSVTSLVINGIHFPFVEA